MSHQDFEHLPSYAELSAREDAPKGTNWGLFGADDQLGTVNFLTPEKVREAAALVRHGKVFALNLPLHLPSPALLTRKNPQHHIIRYEGGGGHDDYLDQLYLHASSHWDGLTHIGSPRHGLYNGVRPDQVTGEEGTRNGIEHWAQRGIVGRGVLLDVARYVDSQGKPIDPWSSYAIKVDVLEATVRAQSVEIRPADILLLRTGWLKFYLAADQATREHVAEDLRSPGLEGSMEMAGWLWDRRIAALGTDCPAVEPWPWDPSVGVLHARVLCYLGMPIGEMFDLEALADDCARDGTYECMFTSAPLNLLGGVGSPPNALAIR